MFFGSGNSYRSSNIRSAGILPASGNTSMRQQRLERRHLAGHLLERRHLAGHLLERRHLAGSW
jgi:hypothetical protein